MNKDARTKAVSSRSSAAGRKTAPRPGESTASSRRTLFVLTGLLFGLGITGTLLHVLAPPPLTREAPGLLAVSQEQPVEQVFDTPIAIQPGHWRWIYVHLGDGPRYGADAADDHFIVTASDSTGGAAIIPSPRWTKQLSAGNVPGVRISDDCLSICMVGDADRRAPTSAQQARALELVSAIQRQLGIGADHVLFADGVQPSGGGQRVPLAASGSGLVR